MRALPPRHSARQRSWHALIAFLAAVALVVGVLPNVWSAQARPAPQQAQVGVGHQVVPAQPVVANKKKKRKKRVARVLGQPSRNYVIPPGSLFTFPNKGKRARMAIRNRVLFAIQSTWGGPRDRYGAPVPNNGRIRIVTWTFEDWAIARALVAAKKRGVSVQVLAAKRPNRPHAPWHWLRKKLGTKLYRPGVPHTNYTWSFARACKSSCRGRLGTPHAKYFLFDRVGLRQARRITVQSSANLTSFAVSNQWNDAQVLHSARVYDDFYRIFRQARINRPLANPYSARAFGNVVNFFFPRPRMTPATDPVYQTLRPTNCVGAQAGGTGRTQINITQYAIHGDRGEWLARKLRFLWQRGCKIAIIYSVASRPVLEILRSGSGRGPIPMRQSVETDGTGTITSYNHSKSMTIIGNWAGNPAAYVTFNGSANWANLAAGSDEQMQRIIGRTTAIRYLRNFKATWAQPSAHMPGYGHPSHLNGRFIQPPLPPDVPEDEPAWGKGVFKYMQP